MLLYDYYYHWLEITPANSPHDGREAYISVPATDPVAMTEHDDSGTLTVVPELEQDTVHRVVRTALALVGLLFVLGLVAVLPGVDRLVDALAVPPVAVGLALATVLAVAALLWVAPDVERAVEQSLDGPAQAVADAAASGKLLVGFLAVVVAHRGFGPVVTHLFGAFDVPAGLYDLGFLVVGLLVLGALVRRLHRVWGPVSRLIAARVVDASERRNDRVHVD